MHHVSDDKSKSMVAECHENSSLIENAPHLICDLIDHIFSLFNTWIVVQILERGKYLK